VFEGDIAFDPHIGQSSATNVWVHCRLSRPKAMVHSIRAPIKFNDQCRVKGWSPQLHARLVHLREGSTCIVLSYSPVVLVCAYVFSLIFNSKNMKTQLRTPSYQGAFHHHRTSLVTGQVPPLASSRNLYTIPSSQTQGFGLPAVWSHL
jgi:hypothetical protein